MKSYNSSQFKKLIKRFHKEFGKKDINSWSDFYKSLSEELIELKNKKKIDEEKIETEAILEYCKQYSDNANVKFSITVASLIYSVIATMITFFSQSHPDLFSEKMISITLVLTISALLIAIITIFSFVSCRIKKTTQSTIR